MQPTVLTTSPGFGTAGDAADRLSAAGFGLLRQQGPVPVAGLATARCQTDVRLTGLVAVPAGVDDILTLDRGAIPARAVNAKDLSR
jgi:hypothetical protein